jgi:tetratricopeptide (TPR) repeat protein
MLWQLWSCESLEKRKDVVVGACMFGNEYVCDLRNRAKEAHHLGKAPVVIELLSSYLTQQAEDGFAWFMYGKSLRALGRSSEAIVAIKNTLGYAPENSLPDMHILLGVIYHDSGQFDEAERWYALAAEGDTDSERGWLWIFRGINFAKMENFSEATQCFSHALDIDYNQDEAYLNLAQAFMAMRKYPDAVDALEKALSLSPNYKEVREALDSLEGVREACEFVRQIEEPQSNSLNLDTEDWSEDLWPG